MPGQCSGYVIINIYVQLTRLLKAQVPTICARLLRQLVNLVPAKFFNGRVVATLVATVRQHPNLHGAEEEEEEGLGKE